MFRQMKQDSNTPVTIGRHLKPQLFKHHDLDSVESTLFMWLSRSMSHEHSENEPCDDRLIQCDIYGHLQDALRFYYRKYAWIFSSPYFFAN